MLITLYRSPYEGHTIVPVVTTRLSDKGYVSFSPATDAEVPSLVARNSHFLQGKGRQRGQSQSSKGNNGVKEVPVTCC